MSPARAGLSGRRMASVVRGWRFSRASGPVCVIGDVHGHSDKLRRLWDRLPQAVGGDDIFDRLHVVFLGDYCDKGPDTRGTVDWLLQLGRNHPAQKHFFLCGNHDFALSAFLGLLPERRVDANAEEDAVYGGTVPLKPRKPRVWTPPKQGDYSPTWRHYYKSKIPDEKLYDGPGHERMHLQGVRYAAQPWSVFDSEPTFESYGVPYADREGLLREMPIEHQRFFADLQWVAKIRSNIGDVLAVHAGLEDEPLPQVDKVVHSLRMRDPALLYQPFIEPFCGRANVERIPTALLAPILQKRGYLPPPLFLISGHHGFVRVNGRRIILDMCAGREDKDLAALVLQRDGQGSSHTQLSNDQGLSMQIVTSRN